MFLKEVNDNHIVYRFLGIKISLKNPEYVYKLKLETERLIKIQDSYDLEPLKSAKKLILFLTPAGETVTGGEMSIYSLSQMSRELNPDSLCLISTYPNAKNICASNNKFLNNEQIYRFSQIVNNCRNLDEITIHIPEYYVKNFYRDLNFSDKCFLKSIKNVQLNIMNQNIELMPKPIQLKNLYKLTDNITQTIAHERYATQEVCDKWQIPTHLFSVHIDLSKYKSYSFTEKEKIIVLSPDKHELKDVIVDYLKKEMPEFEFITVQNMTFEKYMDLIARAYFTITFGEGFDGYFIQPQFVKSVGFAVYNDTFFPNKKWQELLNVYQSYQDMAENIVKDMKKLLNDSELYERTYKSLLGEAQKIYNIESYKDNLIRFYNKKYDFYPVK